METTRKAIFARIKLLSIATAAMAAQVSSAYAYDFRFGDGWDATWTSSLSVGTAIRLANPDKRLYGQANGALVGKHNGTGNNTTDEGELNYGSGDPYSTPMKLISEVEVKRDDLGVLVRGKAWYDYTLENSSVNFGNQNNGYNHYNLKTNSLGSSKPLSDKGFETLNKYSGIDLLDAYIYDTFQIAEQPLQLRVGQQVVNWGESLFIQGLNQINPIDVPSLRKPGTQLKEVFIPVPIVYGNQSLGKYGSLEAFYQVQWRDTPIDAGCGNYWSVAISQISAKPGSCFNSTAFVGSNPFAVATGTFIPTIHGERGRDAGEFGAAYHLNVPALDTEFGLYGMQFNSRTPVLNAHYGNFSSIGGSLAPFAATWDYPNDIKVFGASASTEIFGWSVAGEVSRTLGFPAQIDGNDLLFGSLAFIGPFAPNALAASHSPSGFIQGYTRTNKTQFQVNTIKAGRGLGLGENLYVFVAEAGFQWNNLDTTTLRYNRPFIFGPGSSAAYGGNTCALGLNISPEGCSGNGGYTTNFAWGYRLKGELTYENVWGTGVTMYPGIFFSHDVSGYSVDNQFSADRMALALSLRFNYQEKYTLELDAVGYNPDAKYDPLRDRYYLAATATVNF